MVERNRDRGGEAIGDFGIEVGDPCRFSASVVCAVQRRSDFNFIEHTCCLSTLNLTTGALAVHRQHTFSKSLTCLTRFVIQIHTMEDTKPSTPSSGERHTSFPFMDLPTDLRLMVYDNMPTDRVRILRLGSERLYYQDIDPSLLYVSRLVRQEALPIFRRLRLTHATCVTINFGTDKVCINRLRCIAELLLEDVENDSCQYGDMSPAKDPELSVLRKRLQEYENEFKLSDSLAFRAFYLRTLQQYRNSGIFILRLLLNVDRSFQSAGHFLREKNKWRRKTLDQGAMQLDPFIQLNVKIIFVVRPANVDRCRAWAAELHVLPNWLSENDWEIEEAVAVSTQSLTKHSR